MDKEKKTNNVNNKPNNNNKPKPKKKYNNNNKPNNKSNNVNKNVNNSINKNGNTNPNKKPNNNPNKNVNNGEKKVINNNINKNEQVNKVNKEIPKEVKPIPVPTPTPKPVVIEKEETIDDVDIVFETRKIPKEEILETLEKEKDKEKVKEEVKVPKKKKKKLRLSLRGLIILLLLFILIDTVFIATVITLSNKKKDRNEEDIVEIKVDDNKDKDKEEPKKEPEKVPEKEKVNIEDEKLEKIGYVNRTITFFKEENIDRYIAFKEKNPKYSNEEVVVYVNIGLDNDYYTNIEKSPYGGTNKVLANKYYALDSSYEPSDLTAVNSKYSSGTRKLTKDAAEAFNKMAKAAKNEGYTVRAVSTYRSYLYQKDLYNKYVNKDGKAKADTYSARPGHSEHQTGLAVDVDNGKEIYTDFGETKEFDWMKENAYKYGFILRYTKDTEWITGYKDEPWHYRYVGLEIAKYIHENPMTYEEYFVRFLDK